MTPPDRSRAASAGSPGFWVVGNDPRLAEIVLGVVAGTGTQVRVLEAMPEPIESSPPIKPDWLLVDLRTKGVAPSALEEFKKANPSCQLFLVAGDPRSPVAVELARLGVRHWFVLPLDAEEVRRVFRAALRSWRAAVDRARRESIEIPSFPDLIGQAPAFRAACDLAQRAARSPSTLVLIEGETGTGKGLFARAIHRHSPRSDNPFVEVNCASLPGQLLESELFGHEKGAFTHAQSAKPGLIELADGGSFFLDEVGETDPQVQAKVLKFLDSGRFRRVGGIEEREVDVRVLTATQKNLEEEVREGRFRGDLFHRLHVIRVRIPPIRERAGDLELLLAHYLAKFAARQGRPELRFSREAIERLSRHDWPGNVREIVNLCERLVLLTADHDEILVSDLPEFPGDRTTVRGKLVPEGKLRLEIPDRVTFDAIERAVLEHALERNQGNVSAAASSLGMGRGQFRYRMERLGMQEADDKPRAKGRGRRA
ncbi:MAG: sigma-54-dependent Fis family transcriptional regulator [Candidatus Eisenbacteria bacterium]|nr:sigma-54-dependent Fis family transcriptional regulator [Candidatus Eisenbacteria bacterium]